MTDVTDRSDEPSRFDEPSRGATELILGALAGSALLPFVQALATKAGDDVYQLVRDKLSRRGRRNAEAEIREAGTVTLAGSDDSGIVLRLPNRITPTMAARLENAFLPVDRDGWVLVWWDEGRGRWVVEAIPEPPPEAHRLDR